VSRKFVTLAFAWAALGVRYAMALYDPASATSQGFMAAPRERTDHRHNLDSWFCEHESDGVVIGRFSMRNLWGVRRALSGRAAIVIGAGERLLIPGAAPGPGQEVAGEVRRRHAAHWLSCFWLM